MKYDASAPSHAVKRKKSSFVIFFLLITGVCGIAGFLSLRSIALNGAAERREISRLHLIALEQLLKTAVSTDGEYPLLMPEIDEKNAELAVNPARPGESGYVYAGAARRDDPPDTIILYEDTPPEKRKLGRQVLRLDGAVELLDEPEFQRRIKKEESDRIGSHRPWRLQAVSAAPSKSE